MENLITVFKNIKDINQPFFAPCLSILERIRNGKSRDLVNKIRFEDDKTKRNVLKQGLPSVCFSGQFKRRVDAELTMHSGLMCLDFDGYNTVELMAEAKDTLSKDKYTYSVFISPSGKGLKLLVRIPREPNNHARYFLSLQDYYDSPHFDVTSKNISRVCYESYDPEIFINEDSVEWNSLGVKEYKEVVRNKDVATVPITDENRIVDILMHWWKRNYPMSEGGRNQNVFVLSSALNDYGVNKHTAMSILSNYQEKSFPESEIRQTVDSAYSHVQNFGTKYYEDADKLDSLRSDMRGGSSKKDIRQRLSGMNIDSSMAIQIVDKLDKEVSGNKFWTKTDKGTVKIIHISFKRYLESNGFYKYSPEGSHNYVFVKVTNNLIDHTSDKEIKTFVLDYLLTINDDSVYNYFAENTKYFREDFLTLLGSVTVHFIDDKKDLSHLYFNNTVVKVTLNNIELIDYIDLGGYVWKDHVIDRDFKIETKFDCDFRQFINNVSLSNEGRVKAMESSIGYLMHGFKSPQETSSIILNDEVISDNPEGGTGKGLIMKALGQLKKMVVIDGKMINLEKSFPYQLVSADTQILVFDDVKNHFNFEKLFSVVTEGITLEKKNKDAIKISYAKSPKVAITTNYAIKGSGGSNDRRKFELELHQYYSIHRTPYTEFGKFMFDEWDVDEWSRFDNYMINCLKNFLNTGLVESEFVNLKIRKLSAQTCHEFIEWLGIIDGQIPSDKVDRFVNGHQTIKSELYMDFIEEYPDFAPKAKMTISRNRFYKWLDTYCMFKGQTKPDTGRGASGRWIRFITKHKHEENLKIEL